jgi:hypothetical protein
MYNGQPEVSERTTDRPQVRSAVFRICVFSEIWHTIRTQNRSKGFGVNPPVCRVCAVPLLSVGLWVFLAIGSQLQRKTPVRASKALTTPLRHIHAIVIIYRGAHNAGLSAGNSQSG